MILNKIIHNKCKNIKPNKNKITNICAEVIFILTPIALGIRKKKLVSRAI